MAIYKHIILDSAGLFYRMQYKQKSPLNIVKKMITYVESDILSHLENDGNLYILFDPISMSDLGEARNFVVPLNKRKKILSDYKANRSYNSYYLEAIELFRKYYIYRGPKIKLIYSNEYEADDFVEPLLDKILQSGVSVALCTRDHDWSKYIIEEGDKIVHVINDTWEEPFRKVDFEAQYEFKPTKATVIMYLSLIGDKSDNITGALFMKKLRWSTNIKVYVRDYLKELGGNNFTLNQAIDQFKMSSFSTVDRKTEKSAFDKLYLQMAMQDMKLPIFEKMNINIRVIRSALEGKDITPYLHDNKEQPKINDVTHAAIFGQKFSKTFGKI